MDFSDIKKFQDSILDLGIGGNDLAIYLEGKEVYRYSTGYQDIEKKIKINKDTMFRMFSMTKPITCVAAMQLFEKGKFLLNDDVATYLPEFADMMVVKTNAKGKAVTSPAKKKIEIHHLFEMAAGFTYDLWSPSLKELYEKTDYHYTTEEFVKAIAKEPLIYEPGESWAYSLAHDVLARLVEVCSGMRFADYVQKNIFDVLDMKTATFHLTKDQEARLCKRYGFDENNHYVLGDPVNPYQMSENHDSGGAGSCMTIDDYAKFAYAMCNEGIGMNKKRILARRTIDLMREDHLSDNQYQAFGAEAKRLCGYSYGLGMRTMYDTAKSGLLSPEGEFGWGGAWGTYTFFDPQNHLCAVYGEQAVDTKADIIQRRILNLTYAALEWEGYLE